MKELESQAVSMGMSQELVDKIKAAGLDLGKILALIVKFGPIVVQVLEEFLKILPAAGASK